MDLTRREALLAGAVLLAAPGRAIGAGVDTNSRAPLFVSVLLRGGADGLQLAPPRGDRNYRRERRDLDPGEGLGIGSGFSLHPALADLAPIVERGRLAVVPAVGLPAGTRSHFEAQDRLEWGDVDTGSNATGWLARALDANPEPGLHALAIAPTLPLALRGSSSLAVEHPAQLGLASVSRAALGSLREVFAAGSDPASRAGLEALEVWRRMEPALRGSAGAAGAGRRGGRRRRAGLAAAVEQLVALDTNGFPLSTVWLESDGWDTHRGQKPTAAHHLADLGAALGALWSHFAPRRELSVVVTTEFGRTLRPNGSGGTDHGTGSAALVVGTRVRGGVAGEWPGLAESALFEGRDLDPRADLREVYAEALEASRRSPVHAAVFPGLARSGLGLFEATHS